MISAEPGTWVVDASVAFGWFATVPGSDPAVRLGAITAEQFQALAHRAAEPFSRLIPSSSLLSRAAHWCLELDHPAYDCLYVALAEQERATLITADQRLLSKLALPRPGLPAAIDLACLTG